MRVKIKIRTYIIFLILISSIISATILVYPVLHENNMRNSSLNSPTDQGAFFLYSINANTNYYSSTANNSRSFVSPSGQIMIKWENNHFTLEIKIVNTPFSGEYYKNYSPLFGNSLLNLFVRSSPPAKDSIISIGNVSFLMNKIGEYFNPFTTDNASLAKYINIVGETSPVEGTPIDVKGVVSSSPQLIKNQIQYDEAGGYGVLTMVDFTGSWSILSSIFNSSGISSTNDLNIELFASNVAIGPLNIQHYLFEYPIFPILIWIGTIICVNFVVSISKRRKR